MVYMTFLKEYQFAHITHVIKGTEKFNVLVKDFSELKLLVFAAKLRCLRAYAFCYKTPVHSKLQLVQWGTAPLRLHHREG